MSEKYTYFYEGQTTLEFPTEVQVYTFQGTFLSEPENAFSTAKMTIKEFDYPEATKMELPKGAFIIIKQLHRL